jgi:hypothetical protein
MIRLEECEKIFEMAKQLRNEVRSYKRKREKDTTGWSGKRLERMSADLNFQAIEIYKKQHALHVAVVQSGVADKFEDEYYGNKVFRPSGFQDLLVKFEKP